MTSDTNKVAVLKSIRKRHTALPKNLRIIRGASTLIDRPPFLLNVPNPARDRRTPNNERRIFLSPDEINELRLEKLIKQVTKMIDEEHKSETEISHELGITLSETKDIVDLINEERPIIREIRRVLAIIFDIELGILSRTELCERAEISQRRFQYLTEQPEWDEVYNEMFPGNDLRQDISREHVMSFLPQAVKTIHALMIDASTPSTVRLNAAKHIITLSGFKADNRLEDNRSDLVEFLKEAESENGVNIPREYQEEIGRIIDVQVLPVQEDEEESNQPTT